MTGSGGMDPSLTEVPFPDLRLLATATPHSNTPFETVGSAGIAMTIIGLLELIGRWRRVLLAPLAALGSMSLTVYCGHVLAIWLARDWDYTSGNGFFWPLTLGFVVFAMAWLWVWARGPLEHLVHVISVRATRA